MEKPVLTFDELPGVEMEINTPATLGALLDVIVAHFAANNLLTITNFSEALDKASEIPQFSIRSKIDGEGNVLYVALDPESEETLH